MTNEQTTNETVPEFIHPLLADVYRRALRIEDRFVREYERTAIARLSAVLGDVSQEAAIERLISGKAPGFSQVTVGECHALARTMAHDAHVAFLVLSRLTCKHDASGDKRTAPMDEATRAEGANAAAKLAALYAVLGSPAINNES